MATPKVLVFDLGKVLVDFDYSIAARKIAARGRHLPEQVGNFMVHSPLLAKYETGMISKREFFDAICAATGYCGTLDEFANSFADIFQPIPEMVSLQANLRGKGFPCYIFSNTNEIAVSHIRAHFPFFDNFDGYILSYEHGAMKPDPALYQILEAQARARGSEILYLDDRPENVAAGAARGWQTILHQTPQQTHAVMKAMEIV